MLDQEIALLTEAMHKRDRRIGKEIVGRALLTKGDGTGALLVTHGRPREIWARWIKDRSLFVCYLPPNPSIVLENGHTEYERIEVRIGYDADSDRLQVLDQLSLAGQESIGTTSPMEALIYQALYTALGNLATLRARITTPVSSNDVYVDGPYPYSRPSSGALVFFNGGSVGSAIQTAITALAAAQHQIAIVYLDKETGLLGIQTGTATSATGSLPSRSELGASNVTAISLRYYQEPIIPIYLYFNQATVEEVDFYRTLDLRQVYSKAVARPAEKLYLYSIYGSV